MVQVASKTHTMCRLDDYQLKIKTDFINNYIKAKNAAEGSTFDPNSNVTTKKCSYYGSRN